VIVVGYAGGHWYEDIAPRDWWFSLSPLARAPEFLLGALLAQIYLLGPRVLLRDANHYLQWMGVAGCLWVIGLFSACYAYPALQATFGFAPGIAMLMYYFASYRSRLGGLFETPAMLAIGDASYSTYMLHGFVIAYVFKQTPHESTGLRVALAWGCVTVISILVYRYFELPARRFIRAFRSKHRTA
jgi:peptidoglycan/LPS O-acetylase OafA/YrhL